MDWYNQLFRLILMCSGVLCQLGNYHAESLIHASYMKCIPNQDMSNQLMTLSYDSIQTILAMSSHRDVTLSMTETGRKLV